MTRWVLIFAASICLTAAQAGFAQGKFEEDIIKTSAGDLKITLIGHGTLMFAFGGKIIHVDPVPGLADYSQMPKADLILVTHEHGDHLDVRTVKLLSTETTRTIVSTSCAGALEDAIVLGNGEIKDFGWTKVEAVPAYNITHKRPDGTPYHPKGRGNGYVVTLGNKRIYVAGDTENIPEMKDLNRIDIAFLPMNLPYTMTPEMEAEAARSFKPKILYPYHFGNSDTAELLRLLSDEKGIEVRIRKMK